MNAPVLAATRPRAAGVLAPVSAGAGLLALAFLFRAEISAALHVWSTSTAYGHCFLVLPIAGWLWWERREAWREAPARASPAAALLAVPLAAVWLAADLLGIMEGRQLASLLLALLLVPCAYGWRRTRAAAVPLAYCVFLVPFGAFLTPALQRFTAGFIDAGLDVLAIPHEIDAFHISIPEGDFYVAEACAGLRFLIASVAFGALYAVTLYRRASKRILFILASAIIPVVANGVRALGIVLLGHALGSAEAGAADHLIYGWVFFSAVLLLLAAVGLPFRDDGREVASKPKSNPPAVLNGGFPAIRLLSVTLVVAVAAGASSFADGLDTASPAETVAFAPLAAPAGCTGSGDSFLCGAARVTVERGTLPRANPSKNLATLRARAAADAGANADLSLARAPGANPPVWTLLSDHETGRVAAFAVRVGGRAGAGGLGDRLRLARVALLSGPAPEYAIIRVDPAGAAQADDVLRRFLSGAGERLWATSGARP